MPGNVYWTGGSGDGAWATAGNWSTSGTGSPGSTPPGNGDTVMIGTTNQAIVGATVATTTLTIIVTEGFGGTIGADSPLIFSNGVTSLKYGGRGAYANFGGGTYAASQFNLTGGQQVVLSTGTHTALTTTGGNVTIAAATIVTTLNNVSSSITAGYNATVFTTLNNAGTITFLRSATTLNAMRGTAIQQNNGVSNFTLCTTANVDNGAVYNKQSGGTDTTVNVFAGGKFTITGQAGGVDGTVTVTTLNEWAGSKIVDAVPGFTLTITTRNKVGASGANDL